MMSCKEQIAQEIDVQGGRWCKVQRQRKSIHCLGIFVVSMILVAVLLCPDKDDVRGVSKVPLGSGEARMLDCLA